MSEMIKLSKFLLEFIAASSTLLLLLNGNISIGVSLIEFIFQKVTEKNFWKFYWTFVQHRHLSWPLDVAVVSLNADGLTHPALFTFVENFNFIHYLSNDRLYLLEVCGKFCQKYLQGPVFAFPCSQRDW